jgi:hypothetical protein
MTGASKNLYNRVDSLDGDKPMAKQSWLENESQTAAESTYGE